MPTFDPAEPSASANIASARSERDVATSRHQTAVSDARYARVSTVVLATVAFYLLVWGIGSALTTVLVLSAAAAIIGISQRRVNKREREMVVARARVALMEELLQQAASERNEARIIDLRDGALALQRKRRQQSR